ASTNFNLSHNSTDRKFFLELSSGYSYDMNNSSGSPSIFRAFTLPPNYPDLLDANGSLVWNYKDINLDDIYGNPLSYLKQGHEIKNYNLNSNLRIGYKILPGLVLQSSLGYNTFSANEHSTFPKASQNPAYNPFGRATFGENKYQTWIIEPQLDYKANILKGRLQVVVGSTFQQNTNDRLIVNGQKYTNDNLLGSISGAGVKDAQGTSAKYRYNALFGRLNYIFNNKYLLNLTARRDGSSRFGPGNQFGNFGSAGAGWIFSEESFFKRNFQAISYGKLRASYGTAGSDNIGDFQYIATYVPYGNGAVNYQGSTAYDPQNLFNPNFGWSVTKKFEAGIDVGLFQDRILATVAFYQNRTGDQLVAYTLPIQAGFSGVTRNAPYTVQNKGWEISVTSVNIKTAEFNWTSTFNLSIPKNILLSFPNIEGSSYKNTYVVGQPLTVLQKLVCNGVNDSTGIFEFEDLDKNGSLESFTDYKIIGHLDPEFYGGLNNSIRFKGFQLDFLLYFCKQMGANY
ncbi:MAG: TonB-dependent receptor, partial [Chitinophagaceae bacterium]|nr:TonB-dependent receptor [Chitinophagaceae bacterium]